MFLGEHDSDFYRNIVSLHRQDGQRWLKLLPDQIAHFEQLWGIDVGKPYSNLSYNFIAAANTTDGIPAVLKLGFPNKELCSEIEALKIYSGRGSVDLLAAEAEQGALLLECLKPGQTLKSAAVDDDQATYIAAEVMQSLWRDPPNEETFPTVAVWGQGFCRLRRVFEGSSGPFPEFLVAKAEGIFAEYLASSNPGVLLHGDLHHENILFDERRGWLAIDPKGVIGEPAYEVGALLRNVKSDLLEERSLQSICERRIAILAEKLGFSRTRILGWGLAQAVLSAWWSYEDHGTSGDEWLSIAQSLYDLM